MCKILRKKIKPIISFILLFTLFFNTLGLLGHKNTVYATSKPVMKEAKITNASFEVGTYPTLELKSEGCSLVQYNVFLYLPEKKTWENVTYGYTTPTSGEKPYKVRLRKPLHEGENSFSIWVKKANSSPENPAGYDSFLNYKINIGNQDNTIAEIKNIDVEDSNLSLGANPSFKITSESNSDVQYKMFLYSQDKNIWEDASNGYSKKTDPSTPFTIKSTKALKPGENIFSIWIKKSSNYGQDSYDSFVHKKINISINNSNTKITKVNVPDSINEGEKPEINVAAKSSKKGDIQFKTFLYSNSKNTWVESSNFGDETRLGQEYTIKLNKELEAGINKVLIWSKNSSINGETYEDYKIVEINALKVEIPEYQEEPEITPPPTPYKQKIVIDPGHGGKDSGAKGANGSNERDVVLDVAFKLGDILKAQGYEVLYTRESNSDVNWDSSNQSASLSYRTKFANSNNADIFVSLHCNSNKGTPGKGTETYYNSKKSKKDKELAENIQKELVKAVGFHNRGVKTANFIVIQNTKMPAALVELGFINNPNEEKELIDPIFQQKAAEGIAQGINNYFK